ncbi:MAG: hypothetical protein AB8G05_22270, partial [Oligoflexales bacterium]
GRFNSENSYSISHQTIYKHVHEDTKNGGSLHKYMRSQKKKRRPYGTEKKDKRGKIKNRVGIENRPEIVDLKTRKGDWEGDLIIGKNHQQAFVNYDKPTKDTNHPLKKAMIDHQLSDGCVTATFVLWKEEFDTDDVDELPTYLDKDVRPMLFANSKTADALVQHYNNTHISEYEKDALVATIPHIHGGMLPSTKEPDLLEVLAGHANNPSKYSICSIRDLGNGDEFKIIGSKVDQGPWIGTLGGFLNAASMARLASLQLTIKARELQNKLTNGTQISSKLLIFSKPRLSGLEDFAQQKIKQLFSNGDAKLGEENIEVVKCQAKNDIGRTIRHSEYMEQLGIRSEINRLGVYWDISGALPAAQAGKSYLLVYLIANEARKQLDQQNQMTFNPLSQEEEILFTSEAGIVYDLYGKPVSNDNDEEIEDEQ